MNELIAIAIVIGYMAIGICLSIQEQSLSQACVGWMEFLVC